MRFLFLRFTSKWKTQREESEERTHWNWEWNHNKKNNLTQNVKHLLCTWAMLEIETKIFTELIVSVWLHGLIQKILSFFVCWHLMLPFPLLFMGKRLGPKIEKQTHIKAKNEALLSFPSSKEWSCESAREREWERKSETQKRPLQNNTQFHRQIPLSIDKFLNPFVWFQFELNDRREFAFWKIRQFSSYSLFIFVRAFLALYIARETFHLQPVALLMFAVADVFDIVWRWLWMHFWFPNWQAIRNVIDKSHKAHTYVVVVLLCHVSNAIFVFHPSISYC